MGKVRSSALSLFGAGVVALVAAHPALADSDVTAPGDPITGIYQTLVGGNSITSSVGTNTGQYPAAEAPQFAIDNSTATKYLNFGNGNQNTSAAGKGVGTGFFVTPASGFSVLTGVHFAAANDSPERDPLTITIEGTTATSNLNLGSSWTLIYSGPTGLATDPGRNTFGPIQSFLNGAAYTSYRVLISSERDAPINANSVQYSEIELIGHLVPAPAGALSLGFAGFVMGARRRSR